MKKLYILLIALFTLNIINAQSLTDSLLLYYPFNGNPNDASGNGYNGTVYGPTLTLDRFGNPNSAYDFLGTDDYIDLPNVSKLKPQLPFSVSLWVNFNDLANYYSIFSTDYSETQYTGCWINLGPSGSDNSINISYGDGGLVGDAAARRTKSGTTKIQQNQWYHVIAVFRGANDMDIYINCKNDNGTYSGTGGSIAYSNYPGSIGRHNASNGVVPSSYYYLNGKVDDVKFWNRALTQNDIDNICNPCGTINQKITSVQADRNNICINDNGNITLTAHGGIGDTLKWYTGGCGMNYIGKDTVLVIPSPTQTTTYYARWESNCDPSACDSIVINVGSEIKITKNPLICEGETYSVGISNYTASGFYTDILKTVSGCDSIITTNLTVNPVKRFTQDPLICEGGIVTVGIHNYSATGTYMDTLQTVSGCDSIVTTNLTVNPIPYVSLGNDTIICPGEFILLSPDPGFSSYKWSDGSGQNNLKVIRPGSYSVFVSDGFCTASDTVFIDACNATLWFPNVFTPNEDNINDHFRPVINGTLRSYKIIIFNKWGQQLYESTDGITGWDGTYKGSLCPEGVYYFITNFIMGASSSAPKQRVKRGAVTLLR